MPSHISDSELLNQCKAMDIQTTYIMLLLPDCTQTLYICNMKLSLVFAQAQLLLALLEQGQLLDNHESVHPGYPIDYQLEKDLTIIRNLNSGQCLVKRLALPASCSLAAKSYLSHHSPITILWLTLHHVDHY